MRSHVYLLVAVAALAGCSKSPNETVDQALSDIDAGIIANDAFMIKAGAEAIEEVSMQEALDHDRDGPQACYLMRQGALHTFSTGSRWYADWVKTKSEDSARRLWGDMAWVDDPYPFKDGECGDPFIEKLHERSIAFAKKARPTVLAVFPKLEKTIMAEYAAEYEKQKAAEGTSSSRWARCEPNSTDMQAAFDQFVRLEDANGKDNETHEAIVGESVGASSSCIHRTMVRALESGMQPPGL